MRVVTAWGARLFLVFGENRVVAGVALAIAELVTAPLTGIWAAIAWGDLVGGRHADSELMARGKRAMDGRRDRVRPRALIC